MISSQSVVKAGAREAIEHGMGGFLLPCPALEQTLGEPVEKSASRRWNGADAALKLRLGGNPPEPAGPRLAEGSLMYADPRLPTTLE
jgi:hypothetical protein